MTNEEFSNGMATMLNSYGLKAAVGDQNSFQEIVLDEYEKSLFLTKAQEDLVQALYSGESIEGESFEHTERLRRYLSKLNKEKSIEADAYKDILGIDNNSKVFTLPDDLWFITYEAVKVSSDDCYNGKYVQVIPTRQDEYHRRVNNPFRGASKRRALRLDVEDNKVEIVYPLGIDFYYVKYLRKPQPIILQDLPDNLSINGVSTETECELKDVLHQKILERAVMLAVRSKTLLAQNRD